MKPRLPTGTARLDDILGGGLPADSINLLAGRPGTGKTILAQQIAFRNATPERPAVYISTVSEPLGKILRYGDALSFFDAKAVGESFFYVDCGGDLVARGLDGLLESLQRALQERLPGIVVIDSFKALHAFSTDQQKFRTFLHEVAGLLTALPITSLWVGEYSADDIGALPEFAVADGILHMAFAAIQERSIRVLEVTKLRGSDFLSGRHAFRISPDGLDVFPRLADLGAPVPYDGSTERVSAGVTGIDAMVGGGFTTGSCTVVAGPTGSGKTIAALQFAFDGARRGEAVVISTLEENPTQLERLAAAFGWTLREDGVHLLYRSPVDVYVDQWVHELLDLVESTGATRVVVDALTELQLPTASDETRFREFMYSLVQRCARNGVTVVMTMQVPELFGITRLAEGSISLLADNVLLLQYLRGGSQIKRAVTVLKSRASTHDPFIHEFTITDRGIVVGGTFGPEQDLR